MKNSISIEDISNILDRAYEIYQETDNILPFWMWLEEQEYSAEVISAGQLFCKRAGIAG